MRKIEKLKQAKKDNKAAQASARQMDENAADGSDPGPDPDYDPEEDLAVQDLAEQMGAGTGFTFSAPGMSAPGSSAPGVGGGFHFSIPMAAVPTSMVPAASAGGAGGFFFSAPTAAVPKAARGSAIEDRLAALGVGETTPPLSASVSPVGALAAAPEKAPSCLPFESAVDVDAAFDVAWSALLPVVILPSHLEKAEEAFDVLCAAVSEAASDLMSDTIAESAVDGEAVLTLCTLREVLRWRARFLSSEDPGVRSEAAVAALSAAEAAARVLHQLLSMSRSWGLLSKWSAGVRKGAAPF